MNEQQLKPCPFCGGEAEFERIGTSRQSCIVACSYCGARHESSDEGDNSGRSWNSRPESGSVGSVVAEIPDYLKVAEGLQELSEHLLAQRGVKRTEKAEELWQSMKGEEAAVYSAFLAQAITPIIEAKVALLSTAHRGEVACCATCAHKGVVAGEDGFHHCQKFAVDSDRNCFTNGYRFWEPAPVQPRGVVACSRCGDPIKVGVCENCAPEIGQPRGVSREVVDGLADLIDGLQNDEKWCNPEVMAHAILTKYNLSPASGVAEAVDRLVRAARFGLDAVKTRIIVYGDLGEHNKANLEQLFLTMRQLDDALSSLGVGK